MRRDIRMNMREIGWKGVVDWMTLVQDRDQWRVFVNTVVNLLFPQKGSVTRNLLHGVSSAFKM
jgi:hypothetical protein